MTLFTDLLGALSAPVKILKANTSLPGDISSSSAEFVGLPVNKLSHVKDFAETLGHAQVNVLAHQDVVPIKQGATGEILETLSLEQMAEGVFPELTNVDTELPAAMYIGKVLPENGNTAPAGAATLIDPAINDGPNKPEVTGLSAPQPEGRSTTDPQISGTHTKLMPTGAIPDAIARINELLQTNAKFSNQMLVETKPPAYLMSPESAPMQPLPSTNTAALLRSAYSLDRAGVSLEIPPKPADGTKQANSNVLLSAGRTDVLPADLPSPAAKVPATDIKTDPLSGALSESKVAPVKEGLDQRVLGVVTSPDESSAPKNASHIPQLTLKPLPGSWLQQGDVRVDRAVADPLQVRVEPQPVNTAPSTQRHVEQRLAAQGRETNRLQADITAALDARVSTESTDRPVAAPARFEPSMSILPKPASTPTSGPTEVSSRQADTAVQDQILRVMSRQALAQGRLTLQLNPHELGSLDIEFSTEKGEVQVAIVARETSTRDLLEASVARLRQSLQDVGVNVGQLDIRQGDRHSGEQGARQSMHQSITAELSGPGTAPEEAVPLQRLDDGGIHIYV